MKITVTQERIDIVLSLAERNATRLELQDKLGWTKGATCTLISQCEEMGLIRSRKGGYHQPYIISLPYQDPEPKVEKKKAVKKEIIVEPKPQGKNWFEGWGGAASLGFGSNGVLT
jgi:hypothetical protein